MNDKKLSFHCYILIVRENINMEYTALAKEVLLSYIVSDPEIGLIRHNENMTFKITNRLNNKCYLLRIHKPATDGLLGIQHTLEGI